MLSKYPRDRHDAGTVERSLDVLRLTLTAEEPAQTPGVALALWVLRRRCPDELLLAYWDAAGSNDQDRRVQGMTAYYHAIVRRLTFQGYHP